MLIRKHQAKVDLTFSDKLAVAPECTGSCLFVGVEGDEMSYKSGKPVFSREAVFPFVNEMLDDSLYWNFYILVITGVSCPMTKRHVFRYNFCPLMYYSACTPC